MKSLISFVLLGWCVGCSTLPAGDASVITVETPRVYNDVSLQQRLQQVRDRLTHLSGFDQAQLTRSVGTVQGAKLSQFQGGVQATMQPVPGVVTVANAATPSGTTQSTNGTTTTGAASTSNTSTVVTASTPNNSLQTTTTAAAITPVVPPLVATTTFATPTQMSQNALSTLEEQLQLEMELVTLQTLLEPPVSAEYSSEGNARRHVTLGFPITIPANATRANLNAAAEVAVTICPAANVPRFSDADPALRPSLITLIPKEKTYNTVSVTNKSFGAGLGAIAGMFNVGGNFSWTNNTYYIVRAQDTVAFGGVSTPDKLCNLSQAGTLRFGWLFKPVLGQSIVQAGMWESLVQLSLPRTITDARTTIVVRTQWRAFDSVTGAAGKAISKVEEEVFENVRTEFDTLPITSLDYQDEKGGLGTVTVAGHFLPGTRVRLGVLDLQYVDINDTGLRFTASNQALATSSITLVSPDGKQFNLDQSLIPPTTSSSQYPKETQIRGKFSDIIGLSWGNEASSPKRLRTVGGALYIAADAPEAALAKLSRRDGSSCSVLGSLPSEPVMAQTAPVSAAHVEVTLFLRQCIEIQPDGTYPLIAVIGGKAFGFAEAPFTRRDSNSVSFVAPRQLIEAAGTVELGKLLLGKQYRTIYTLPRSSPFSVDSIAISSVSEQEIRYLVMGSALDRSKIVSPEKVVLKEVGIGGTMREFTLPATMAKTIKKVILQYGSEPPYVFDLPQPDKKDKPEGDTKKDPKAFILTITEAPPK